MIELLEVGADIRSTDAAAAAAARAHARPEAGRLGELAAWLAGATGHWPPAPLKRVSLTVLGGLDDAVADLAAEAVVAVHRLEPPTGSAAAFEAGVQRADDEIDGGADLLLLSASDHSLAPAVVTTLLTGAEPVALLPRGAAATDSRAWIERAGRLRDARRAVAGLRRAPGELLEAVDGPLVAAATGFALRAAARRTPLVLDGSAALAAAVVCYEAHPRARQWWLVADTSTDPVHTRAVQHLTLDPVLALDAGSGDGAAALLALAVLRAAAALVPRKAGA